MDGSQITGTPIYIEFTEDRVPNLVQLYATAEQRRTSVSDARMTVLLAQPKYGGPMACMSIDDMIGIFAALRDEAQASVGDEDEEPAEEPEPEPAPEEPVVAQKIPVDPSDVPDAEPVPEPPGEAPEDAPESDGDGVAVPGPVDPPEHVMEAMAANISEPEPEAEETVEEEGEDNAE